MYKKIDDSFDELIADLKHTLSFNTDATKYTPTKEDPFGRPMTDALNDFLRLAERHGFFTKNIDNYVGFIDTSSDTSLPLYGLMCHLDIVPVGDESLWNYPPFGGVEENGRIYGRGSFDDKGPAIAALHAMKVIRDNTILKCRFRLIVGLDEETGAFTCLKHYKQTEEIPVFSFSPDGLFPLINAEKGILRITVKKEFKSVKGLPSAIESIKGGVRTNIVPASATAIVRGNFSIEPAENIAFQGNQITAHGLSTHVKQPWKGDNAILRLLEFLTKFETVTPLALYVKALNRLFLREYDGKALGIACEDEISEMLTCTLSIIDADESACTFKMDVRHPVTADGDEIVEKLRNVFSALGATLTLDSRNAPLYVPEDQPFVQLLLGAYTAVTGQEGKPLSTGGGTYCREMPNSVSFGILFPGEESVAHMANEYVNIESLRKAAHIYVEALDQINKSC